MRAGECRAGVRSRAVGNLGQGRPFPAGPLPQCECVDACWVRNVCFLCCSQGRGPSWAVGADPSRGGGSWLEEGRATVAVPSDSELTHLPEMGDRFGRQTSPPRCCHLGSCTGTPRKSLPCFWEENQVYRLSVLGTSFWGPHVLCVVLLSVLLSVSHQCLCPFSPCSSSNTPWPACLSPSPQ